MLSYNSSLIVLIAALVLGILWMLGWPMPRWYKVISLFTRPVQAITRVMVRRKGIFWTALTWWSVAAMAVCLFVLCSDYDWLFKMKVAALSCLPLLACWGLRYGWLKYRQRKYRLPKR